MYFLNTHLIAFVTATATIINRRQVMDNIMSQVLDIVKAQASTRATTSDEISSMVKDLKSSITRAMDSISVVEDEKESFGDPKKAIKEKSVTCLECGKSFKVLTKRHLTLHDLTPEQYKEKWGYKKGSSLVAKSLARERRKTMQGMKLWEKRIKVKKPVAETQQ